MAKSAYLKTRKHAPVVMERHGRPGYMLDDQPSNQLPAFDFECAECGHTTRRAQRSVRVHEVLCYGGQAIVTKLSSIPGLLKFGGQFHPVYNPGGPLNRTIRGEAAYLLAENAEAVERSYLGFGASIVERIGKTAIVLIGSTDADWQLNRLASGMRTRSRQTFTSLETAVAEAQDVNTYLK